MALLGAGTRDQLAWLGRREPATESVAEELELLCRTSEGLTERGVAREAEIDVSSGSCRRAATGSEQPNTFHGVDGGHECEADEGEPEPGLRNRESQQQAAEKQQAGDGIDHVKTRLGTPPGAASAQSAYGGKETEDL